MQRAAKLGSGATRCITTFVMKNLMPAANSRNGFSPTSGPEHLLPEPGALLQWQHEIRKGIRTKYELDALCRAAIAEAHARDWIGTVSVANEYRTQAAEIILRAAVEEAA